MFSMGSSYVYYAEIAFQVLCVLHCLRSGNQNRWIYLIIFLPFIGSIAYFFSEILPSLRRSKKPQLDIVGLINPGSRIKKLEDQLKYSDTFNHRMELADAYLNNGLTEKAIDIYESSLKGAFAENEHAIMQLATAYYMMQRYTEAISLIAKVYKTPQFARSRLHILYAKALEFTGKHDAAELEFKSMAGRFANFEQRYEYGLFLERADRLEEAADLFEQILDEAGQLSSLERKNNRLWFAKVKEELKRIYV